MTKVYEQVLTSFDMQGQAIKDVELVEAKLEDIGQTLPSASDYPNRVLMYNGEIVYSNGEKWINSTELVNMGLSIKDSTVAGIPNGKVEINGTLYTIYTLPTIDNDLMANMPPQSIKANIGISKDKPKDVLLKDVSKALLDEGQLAVKVMEVGGFYVITQGFDDNGLPIEVAKLQIDRVIDEGKSVKGFWDENREVFTEDENGTETALRLTIKASSEDDPTYIYLDTKDLFSVFAGDDTISPTIKVQVVDDTAEGVKRIVATLKENSIEKRHLSASLIKSLNDLQIQADWNQIDATQKDFIKNKPTHLPSPNDSITTEQLQAGVVTNDKLANKTIIFNGQTFELGAGNQNLAPLKNTGFEVVESLPITNNFEGRQVVHQGRTYTFHNGEYQCVADDLGGREETREEQFTYQSTANDESVKDGLAVVKNIKGNTVVANQIFNKNSVTVGTGSSNFYFYVMNTTIASTFPKGHKIYVKTDYICSETYTQTSAVLMLCYGANFYGGYSSFKVIKDNKYHTISKILTSSNNENNTIAVTYNWANDTGLTLNKDATIVIDLTQMFGAGNEPATVEEFERLFPNLPTEYNSGSLLNLNADSIKSVGFNAYNGEYAQVLGGMQYYLGGNFSSIVFKENLEDEGENVEIPSDNLYTPTTNGYLFAEGSNICINLSHSGYRNGEYEVYKESIVNLPIEKYFPDGMKSAGSVRDEIVWDESIEKYKAIQRIGSVDMGTLNWSKHSNSGIFGVHFYEGSDEIFKANNNIICQDYLLVKNQQGLLNTDKSIINAHLYYRGLNVRDDEAWNSMTAAEFKTSLSGKYLYYKLKTPIETIIEDFDLIDYEVSDFGTEEIIAIADEPTTPIVADIQYGFNAVDEIRNHRFAINGLKRKVSDIDTIRTNANTAYGWGNHADAGYAVQTEVTEELNHVYETLVNEIPTELPPTDDSVTTAKIADNSISTSKIQDKAIIGSKIGQEEITTNHIANNSITNAKLEKKTVSFNGTTISLGGIGQMLGLVTANGSRCFLEITNNELILSAPTFAENGSIATIDEIVRYPLYTELPTIGNGTITLQDSLGTSFGSFGLNDTTNKAITIRGVRQYVSDKLIGTTGIIKASEHNCGTAPKVQAWIGGELTLMKVVNKGSGDLIWYSGVVLTEASCCRLIIEGDPDTKVNITI